MKVLEDRILKDGIVYPGQVLKVDSFLNHQMDIQLFDQLAAEFVRLYKDCGINKILTIEASGIGVACITAQHFGCPLVFAKKTKTLNIAGDVYKTSVVSYTHQTTYDVIVSKKFLGPNDKLLIIDDFLANGKALEGLLDIAHQAKAEVVGCGICIEKAFQPGGDMLREQGIRIESLARVKSMSEDGHIEFCD